MVLFRDRTRPLSCATRSSHSQIPSVLASRTLPTRLFSTESIPAGNLSFPYSRVVGLPVSRSIYPSHPVRPTFSLIFAVSRRDPEPRLQSKHPPLRVRLRFADPRAERACSPLRDLSGRPRSRPSRPLRGLRLPELVSRFFRATRRLGGPPPQRSHGETLELKAKLYDIFPDQKQRIDRILSDNPYMRDLNALSGLLLG